MTPFTALTLYPLWAIALAVGLTALRLGREKGRGLVALCLGLALWVTALILLKTPSTEGIAERVLPSGMVLAGASLHAGADVAGIREKSQRRVVIAGYAFGFVVALVGFSAPRLLYGPGARDPGPLFWPLGAASMLGTMLTFAWLVKLAWKASPAERPRRVAMAGECVAGALGGGGFIVLHTLRLGDVGFASPLLLGAIALATFAVLRGELGRARDLVVQGLTYALITAALSAVGLVAFYKLLPALVPDGEPPLVWLVFVVFVATLPLEPLRQITVEAIGRRIFRRPINVPELAREVESSEVRANHAERLAEIGRVASAVAHEIRNPLGVIAAQLKLLERAGAPLTTLNAVRAQIERTKHFVDDLLRYGKPRPIEARVLDAQATTELAASNVRGAWKGERAPSIDVAPHGSHEGAAALTADLRAFTDVVVVLVQNACIAVDGREGGHVHVRVECATDSVAVIVEDNGPGVPPALEASLFQPFVTGRGRDETHPGTGLGLAIAARWIERHGGTLTHERPESGGARFVARWPTSPSLS